MRTGVWTTWAEVNFPRGWGWSKLSPSPFEHGEKDHRAQTPLAKSTLSCLCLCLGQSHILEGKLWCPLVTRKAPGIQEQHAVRPSGQQAPASPAPVISAESCTKGSKTSRALIHTVSWKQSCWGDWGISGHSGGAGPGRGGEGVVVQTPDRRARQPG